MKYLKYLYFILLLFVVGWSYGWLFTGAYHSNPNDEELCLCGEALNNGIPAATLKTLADYDGRYFTNIMHGVNPLAWGWVNGYKWMPVLAILLTIGSLYFFFTALYPQEDKRKIGLICLLFPVVHFATDTSLVHDLYWMASAFVYLYPWFFFLGWTGAYARYLRETRTTPKQVWYVVCLLCLIAAIGINEMMLPINLAALLYIQWRALRKKQHVQDTAVLLWIGVACILFFMFSPGIQNRIIRTSGESSPPPVTDSLLTELKHYIRLVSRFLLSSPVFLLFAAYAYLLLGENPHRPAPTLSAGGNRWLLFFVLVPLGLLCAAAYYLPMGSDSGIPYRIFNTVLFLLLFGMVWYLFGLRYRLPIGANTWAVLKVLCLAGMVPALLFYPNNIRTLAAEYTNGQMTSYNHLMQGRYQLLQTTHHELGGQARVWMRPIENPPTSICFLPDLRPNRQDSHWNNCYENYFGVFEVGLSNDTVAKTSQIHMNDATYDKTPAPDSLRINETNKIDILYKEYQ